MTASFAIPSRDLSLTLYLRSAQVKLPMWKPNRVNQIRFKLPLDDYIAGASFVFMVKRRAIDADSAAVIAKTSEDGISYDVITGQGTIAIAPADTAGLSGGESLYGELTMRDTSGSLYDLGSIEFRMDFPIYRGGAIAPVVTPTTPGEGEVEENGRLYTIPNHTYRQFNVLRFVTRTTFALAEAANLNNYGNVLVLGVGGTGDEAWIRVGAGPGDYWVPNHGITGLIYLHPTTPGDIVQSRPTVSGQNVCLLGYPQGPDLIVVNPDTNFWVVP